MPHLLFFEELQLPLSLVSKISEKKCQRGVSLCSPYRFNAYSMFLKKNLNISCCHVSLFTRGGRGGSKRNRSKKNFYNPEHFTPALLHDSDRLVASRIRVKIAKDSMTSLSLVHPVTIYTTERRTLPFLACVY
jgi:hypothetical protein